MAASSTRRRRRTNTNRSPQNRNNRTDRREPDLLEAANEFRAACGRFLNRVFMSGSSSALASLAGVRNTVERVTVTASEPTSVTVTPQRRRRRASTRSTTASTTATPRTRGRPTTARRGRLAADTSNLGRGNRVLDRVYNALPPSGSINRASLREIVARDNPSVRPQDIGASLRVLEEFGIARCNGEVIERLRAAA